MTSIRIGPWETLRKLGEGGMGVVYAAQHQDSGGAPVALKVARTRDADVVARLRAEIHVLSQIRHDGVVRVIDHGVSDGAPWYAMELLVGRTLADEIRQFWPSSQGTLDPPSQVTFDGSLDRPMVAAATPPPPPRPPPGSKATIPASTLTSVLGVFWRICAPLAELHARAIVHRDLKPENVFLRPDGTPVLMDLGLVSRARGGQGRERLEVAGRVVGTLAYMAPEQATGQIVDARADLYALGAMMYEALTGQKPVESGPQPIMLARILTQMPLAPSELVDGIPPAIDALVMALLAKDPRRRVGHADDVAQVIAPFVPDLAASARPVETRPYLYRPAFHGRAALRADLEARVEALGSGHGGVVYLGGESGVGKTFLIAEIARVAAASDIRVITAECLPVGAGSQTSVVDVLGAPLHPFRAFLVSLADRLRLASARSADQLLGPRARTLAPYEAALATTPSFQRFPAPPVVSAEVSRKRVVTALLDTLAAVAVADRGAILVLDDLQWADDLTLSVLMEVEAGWIARTPLLIIGTWRTEEATPELRNLASMPHVRFEALSRLDREDIRGLVADMLAMADPPERLVRFVHDQTGGNPFFVAEYLRSAVDEGQLVRKEGRWIFAGGDDAHTNIPVPGSLLELVLRRLETVQQSDRPVHDLAAVFGRSGTVRALGSAMGVDETQLLGTLRRSEERQVLELTADGGWRWAHDKIREAAYARIPPVERPALHRRAAEAIEADLSTSNASNVEYGALGRHWSAAGVRPKAVDAYEAAGEQALRNFSMSEAREYFTACVDIAAEVPEVAGPLRRARWEQGLLDAALATGRTSDALNHADAALVAFGFPMPTQERSLQIGLVGQILLRGVQALFAPFFRTRTPLQIEATSGAAYVYQRLLEPHFLANRPIAGTFAGLRAINLGERVPETPALARGLAFMSMIVGATPMRATGARWAERALKMAEQMNRGDVVAYVASRVACFDVAMARWDDAFARLERAQEAAGSTGDLRMVEEAQTIRIQCAFFSGQYEASLAEAEAGIALATARGDQQTLAWNRCFSIVALVAMGRFHDAVQLSVPLERNTDSFGSGERGLFLAAIAAARFGAGDVVGARAAALTALALSKESPPVGYYQASGVIYTAEVLLGLQRKTSDPELIGAFRDASRILGTFAGLYPMAAPAAHRLRAALLVIEGRTSQALRSLDKAIALAERQHQPVEVGAAWIEHAEASPQARREESISRAQAIFKRMGARWHLSLRRG